jgi:hypothetical protein
LAQSDLADSNSPLDECKALRALDGVISCLSKTSGCEATSTTLCADKTISSSELSDAESRCKATFSSMRSACVKSSTELIIGACVGGLVLLGAAVGGVILMKRRSVAAANNEHALTSEL